MNLDKIDPASGGKFKHKEDGIAATELIHEQLYHLLYLMFAESKYSLLVILQGIDASGKDGVVQHIFAGANPQGLQVHSFKKPSEEELKHDFLWRCHRVMPEAGMTAIFNRSYYEEVIATRVHPEYLGLQHLPQSVFRGKNLFKHRYEQINHFEKMLVQNGTLVVKLLLHISKDEQKKRLQERLDDPKKNWKFSAADLIERKHWDEYRSAFNQMLRFTDTKHAPWHVIPADKKWYRNYLVSKILLKTLSDLRMSFPQITAKSKLK